ncbi:MAG: arylesterase [Proteobacteria bacterium]|nr:arylesterase [Pseudomonadota bacterium]
MSRFILFIVWLLAGAAVHAAQNVLVFGDSLSAGYGIRSAEAWPSLLGERLRTQKSDYALVNASLSGETTAGGRTRLPTALQQHRPQVVIIALGANDGLRGLSLDAMRSNLKAMIDAAHAARSRVLLVGMEMPPNYGPDYTRKFRAVYGELARDSKVALVPFLLDGFAEKRELFQADGIHPTAAAQPLIVDNVWPTLKPLLRK